MTPLKTLSGLTFASDEKHFDWQHFLSTEETVAKFKNVHKILVENHYDVIMVDRGARKVCVIQTCRWMDARDWVRS